MLQLNKTVNLTVRVVAHDWEYAADGENPNIGCEVIAVRCSEQEAETIRDECISKILKERDAQKCRHELVVGADGIQTVYAHPYGKWYTKTFRDRVIIEEFTMPISPEQLETILAAAKEGNA